MSHPKKLILIFFTLATCLALAQDPQVTQLTLSAPSVVGGNGCVGTVVLDMPAPTDVAIQLTAEKPASTDPTVTVPAGSETATFPISTIGVDRRHEAIVTATLGSGSVQATLVVTRAHLVGLTLSSEVVGGQAGTATVTLDGQSGYLGREVTILVPDGAPLTAPATVTIPPRTVSATFDFATNSVYTRTPVKVKATSDSGSASSKCDVVLDPIYADCKAMRLNGWSLIGTDPNRMTGKKHTPHQIFYKATTTLTFRVFHKAALQGQSVNYIRLVYANYLPLDNIGEGGQTNSIFVKAGVQRPNAIRPNEQNRHVFKATFNGQDEVEIKPGGIAISDPVYFPLQDGEGFYSRTCERVLNETDKTAGSLYTLGSTDGPTTGEGFSVGDLAYSGKIWPRKNEDTLSPVAILGKTKVPLKTIALFGDSVMAGTGDSGYRPRRGGYGERICAGQYKVAEDPAALPACGYLHMAKGGESAAILAVDTNSRTRTILSCLATNVVCNLGTNDIIKHTNEETRANIAICIRRWASLGLHVIWVTLNPKAHSTDGWMTVESQSLPLHEEYRQAVNDFLRDRDAVLALAQVPSEMFDIFDLAPLVEVDSTGAPNPHGGLWKPAVGGSTPTVEGTVDPLIEPTKDEFYSTSCAFPEASAMAGYCIRFLSGELASRDRLGLIATVNGYGVPEGTVQLLVGLQPVPQVGDQFVVYQPYCIDVVHPSSTGSAYIASNFPLSLLR